MFLVAALSAPTSVGTFYFLVVTRKIMELEENRRLAYPCNYW